MPIDAEGQSTHGKIIFIFVSHVEKISESDTLRDYQILAVHCDQTGQR